MPTNEVKHLTEARRRFAQEEKQFGEAKLAWLRYIKRADQIRTHVAAREETT